MRNLFLLITLIVCFVPGTQAQQGIIDVPSSKLTLLRSFQLNDRVLASPPSPNAMYSNITTYAGNGFPNGGAENQAGTTITRLLADSISFLGAPPYSVSKFVFSVANLNATIVTARPKIRLYAANGPNGSPGTLITGFNFTAITFPASTTQLFSVATPFVLNNQSIWIGTTFDDNAGATGATFAEMNLLGQGMYDPPQFGSSTDTYFLTTAAGSFFSNLPAGADGNFGGAPVANFGWEIVSSAPLPTILSNFTVKHNGTVNTLLWNTSQEINTNHFNIERSNNGKDFLPLGQVAAAGNSNAVHHYQFTDPSPVKGVNYYRIKIIDKNDHFSFSEIKSVKNIGNADLTFYPNPVKDVINVEINAERPDKGILSITDISGKEVYNRHVNLTTGINKFNINTRGLMRGSFNLKVKLSEDVIVKKVVVE